jgi:peptidoglycan/LPS O-acetylase OafA/YrhL
MPAKPLDRCAVRADSDEPVPPFLSSHAVAVTDRAAAARDAAGAYLYMDAFRGLLALAVAFGHAWVLFIRDYVPTGSIAVRLLYGLAGFAHAAVIMFFVLSGYWITRSVLSRVERGWSWSGYLVDRLGRMLAVLVPALLVGGLLDAVGVWALRSPTHLGVTDAWVLRKDVAADLSLATLAGNLVFLQGILVGTFGANGPLWSVAAEFWFYLWFPALLLLLRHGRPSWALASLGLLPFAPALGFYFLVWLCGSAVFLLQRRFERGTGMSRPVRMSVLGVAGAVLLAALAGARLSDAARDDAVLAIAFAAFLLALILARPAFASGMRHLAGFGAQASFSLYALHFPVVAIVAAFAVGDRRLAPDGPGAAIALAALALAVLASLGFARVTEARTGRVRGWLARLTR